MAPGDWLGFDRQLREQEERIYWLREEVKRLEKEALRDPRTELYSCAFFHARLKEEAIRSERYRHFLSVILLHFELQATSSSTEAAQAILAFGRVAGEGLVRRSDLLSKYGERQVALILPETDRAGAEAVGRRCRACFPEGSPGVGVGILSFPEDASNLGMLVEQLASVSERLASGKAEPRAAREGSAAGGA